MKPSVDDRPTWSFALDNDAFIGQDNNYTNGFRFMRANPRGVASEWKRGVARRFPFFPKAFDVEYTGASAMGQHIYTSRDIADARPSPTEHPYGGWLYLETSVVADTGGRFDALRLGVGVVGPVSLAQATQLAIHDIFDIQEPEGWNTQLGNEPTLLISYERRWRLFRKDLLPLGFSGEVMPAWSVNLGNAFTDASAGVMVRFGQNVPFDYGPPRVRPGLAGNSGFETRRRGWYVFGGVEGRAIAQDIFLDGNSFRDSRSVEKRPFMSDLQFGAAIVFPSLRITATQVFPTKRFDTEQEEDGYTSIAISSKF